MPIFYSPKGNIEVWDICPQDYVTPEVWQQMHPVQQEQQALADILLAKRKEIDAGFDQAMIASLTMPSRNMPPSAVELALAIDDFKADDPIGWIDLRAIHEKRRNELLAAVAAATTAAAVQAIVVSYAV